MSRPSSRARSLPSAWEKSPSARGNAKHLEVAGLRVKYIGEWLSFCYFSRSTSPCSDLFDHTGPGSADKDAASVRANAFVPPGQALYYFEVAVLSSGREGYIGELSP